MILARLTTKTFDQYVKSEFFDRLSMFDGSLELTDDGGWVTWMSASDMVSTTDPSSIQFADML